MRLRNCILHRNSVEFPRPGLLLVCPSQSSRLILGAAQTLISAPLMTLQAHWTSSSLAYSAVAYPMQKIQQAKFKIPASYRQFLASPSMIRTYTPKLVEVVRRGGLYRGFMWHTIRMIPGSSVALIIFEGVRRKFAPDGEGIWGGEVVVPTRKDGIVDKKRL